MDEQTFKRLKKEVGIHRASTMRRRANSDFPELSTRVNNALRNARNPYRGARVLITTNEELASARVQDLLQVHNFSRSCLNECVEYLEQKGFNPFNSRLISEFYLTARHTGVRVTLSRLEIETLISILEAAGQKGEWLLVVVQDALTKQPVSSASSSTKV